MINLTFKDGRKLDIAYPIYLKDISGNIVYCQDLNQHWYKCEFNNRGNKIYHENATGFWIKREFDDNGNETYYEDNTGYWYKHLYDVNGNIIYYENSGGGWYAHEWDDKGNSIYHENSLGVVRGEKSKPNNVVEMTMDEISKVVGKNVKVIK